MNIKITPTYFQMLFMEFEFVTYNIGDLDGTIAQK